MATLHFHQTTTLTPEQFGQSTFPRFAKQDTFLSH